MLRRCRRGAIARAILSNGEPDMLADAVRAAGIGDLLDDVLSVEAVGRVQARLRASIASPPTGSAWRPARDRVLVLQSVGCVRRAGVRLSGVLGQPRAVSRTSTGCAATCTELRDLSAACPTPSRDARRPARRRDRAARRDRGRTRASRPTPSPTISSAAAASSDRATAAPSPTASGACCARGAGSPGGSRAARARRPPRLLVAASLLLEGWALAGVAQSFSGGQFGPGAARRRRSRRRCAALEGHTLDHPDMPEAVRLEVPDWICPLLAARFGADLAAGDGGPGASPRRSTCASTC